MGKTSKQKEMATTQKLPDPAWEKAVKVPTTLDGKRACLEALLFNRLPGIPIHTQSEARLNAHRIYFQWDGVHVIMQKVTGLPRPTQAEVEGALLALAEDASFVA